MCLAVPGKILSIAASSDDPLGGQLALVDFQGSRMEVSLQLLPSAREGDWVLVHAGFALQTLNDAEARELWEYLLEAEVVSGSLGETGEAVPEV